jgi:hypothetical protein
MKKSNKKIRPVFLCFGAFMVIVGFYLLGYYQGVTKMVLYKKQFKFVDDVTNEVLDPHFTTSDRPDIFPSPKDIRFPVRGISGVKVDLKEGWKGVMLMGVNSEEGVKLPLYLDGYESADLILKPSGAGISYYPNNVGEVIRLHKNESNNQMERNH